MKTPNGDPVPPNSFPIGASCATCAGEGCDVSKGKYILHRAAPDERVEILPMSDIVCPDWHTKAKEING